MDIPFRLARRDAATAADAFLLLAAGAGALGDACARFGEVPAVFAVRGGFLLVPHGAEARAVPGAVRLRRLVGDLFIPADADLIPALLPDEALALTRTRGLIVLPGGTVLAFEPSPVAVSRWLRRAAVRRAEWRPFPPRPDRPHALGVIERPAPPMGAVIEVLGAGAPDDANPLAGPGEGASGGTIPDGARPPAPGSMLGRAAANAGFAAGGFLAWLGKQLGAEKLARLGGDLARRALERFPRLSEKLLGDQEAALREVLRALQAGDVEGGLRHAPPAVADPDRPARVGTDAKLAPRDPRYSLRDLIARGGGAGTVWLGGGDVWGELAREYHRLATEAAARGDHRRAAYLLGVLLRDLRGAANALMAGGLFRDAALLFRDRLNDPCAAADAFDRAGEYDEALRLYDQTSEYERAAELLRRLGEEERAVEYFILAGTRLMRSAKFLAAGNLFRTKAYRPDLAVKAFHTGWRHTGSAESVACGERLIEAYAVEKDEVAFAALMEEAEVTLADSPRDAGRFFNYARLSGKRFLPTDACDDLNDRVRGIFAGHLRTRALVREAGALVAELFPPERLWPAPVGRDAAFAARGRAEAPAPQPEAPPSPEPARVADRRLIAGPVTAVVGVRGTFDVVVAGAGSIAVWRVAKGEVQPVATAAGRITALAASADGDVIYAVTHAPSGQWQLRCYAAEGGGPFRPTGQHDLQLEDGNEPAIYLQPVAHVRGGKRRITVVTDAAASTFLGTYLQFRPVDLDRRDNTPDLVVDSGDGHCWYLANGNVLNYKSDGGPPSAAGPARWTPTPASAADWLTPAPGVLEVTAVDADGRVRWAEFDARDAEQPRTRSAFAAHPNGFIAACLVEPGVVAAATGTNEVQWIRVGGSGATLWASVSVGLPARIVALVARPDAGEVVAVLADGGALRLRRP